MRNMPLLRKLFTVAIPLAFGLSAAPSLAGTIFVQPVRRQPVRRTVDDRTVNNRTVENHRSRLFQLPHSRRSLPPLTRQATSIATLPDGNYRVATLALRRGLYSSSYTPDPYSASTLFTFRKLGNVITGSFEYLEDGLEACISGTVDGNTIVGQAYTNSGEIFQLNQRYLGDAIALQLGNAVAFNRYDASVLDLNGFTRINTGTAIPPAVCS